ncbi:MAG TPA: DUF3592 domain-containing protein [Planctomycetota bacterium]|nr:DUF3592 domain-containing protein [Planctomycetota bacterium]
MKAKRIVGAVVFVVGVGPLVAAGAAAVSTNRFLSRASAATGEIVGEEADRGRKGGVTYRPIVSFQDASGATHVVATDAGTSERVVVGETVPILYDPASPDDARIDAFLHLWFLPTALGAIGGGFMILGILFAVFARPRDASSASAVAPDPRQGSRDGWSA